MCSVVVWACRSVTSFIRTLLLGSPSSILKPMQVFQGKSCTMIGTHHCSMFCSHHSQSLHWVCLSKMSPPESAYRFVLLAFTSTDKKVFLGLSVQHVNCLGGGVVCKSARNVTVMQVLLLLIIAKTLLLRARNFYSCWKLYMERGCYAVSRSVSARAQQCVFQVASYSWLDDEWCLQLSNNLLLCCWCI